MFKTKVAPIYIQMPTNAPNIRQINELETTRTNK